MFYNSEQIALAKEAINSAFPGLRVKPNTIANHRWLSNSDLDNFSEIGEGKIYFGLLYINDALTGRIELIVHTTGTDWDIFKNTQATGGGIATAGTFLVIFNEVKALSATAGEVSFFGLEFEYELI